MTLISKFVRLLLDIKEDRAFDFTGIGIIIYDNINGLPIAPMNPTPYSKLSSLESYNEVLSTLIQISRKKNENHDGFHLISKDFRLTHVSQYFSTPIVSNIKIEKNHGSRYLTALYGSLLDDVLYTGIIGHDDAPIIFFKGRELNCRILESPVVIAN